MITNYVSNDVNEYTSSTTSGVTTTTITTANGNMTAATTGSQTTNYTFNALNQLTGKSGGPNGTFSYVYDPLGHQISSTVNSQTTNNLIDPFGLGNVAAQFNGSGNLVAHYTIWSGTGQPGQRERSGVLLRLQPSGLDRRDHECGGGVCQPIQLRSFWPGYDDQRGDCESIHVCGAGWGFERREWAGLHAGADLQYRDRSIPDRRSSRPRWRRH